jgi:hypothetical protein
MLDVTIGVPRRLGPPYKAGLYNLEKERPMVSCRLFTTFGVIVGLAGFTSTADADGGGKNKLHATHGLITDVSADGNTITILVHPHKKKNSPAPETPPATVERKFKIDKDTKVEFVSGKKGEREFKPATASDLHKGEHVAVVFRTGQDGIADKVVIAKHKKKQ